VSSSPVRGAGGEIIGSVSVVRDITERKEIEERLRRHVNLLDLAPVLVREMDDRIALWNTGAEEMYGWRSDEALGQVSHSLLATEFPEPLADIKSKLLNTGHWRSELSHLRRDGSRIYVSSHWILHRDCRGMPGAILEINNDITAMKKAQWERKESEDQYRMLFRSSMDAIILTDPAGAGRILSANRSSSSCSRGWGTGQTACLTALRSSRHSRTGLRT
jgi:PAS domain S-box-containing protein